MKTRVLLPTALVLLLGGCSTWLNDTTPAATPGYVYAAGARQKVFTTKATVWLCPTDAKSPDPCRIVDIQVAR